MQKPVVTTQEFSLRIPKIPNKKYEIMKFNSNLNIDFGKWAHAKLEREVVKVDGKIEEEDMPKFGAGSEFGREARQEARKRRYGGNKKVSESSPWILKVGGKKFRGVREGGITDNSSYYVFTHGSDGIINAHKLEEWYNFQPMQRYKTLSAEEAEEEFGRRNKVMNHFNLMLQKRLKNEEDEEIDEEEKGKGKKGAKNRKSKELKISEMDDWVDSEDDESDDGDEQDEEKVESKKKQKLKNKNQAKPKKKSKGSDESAFEESDDGDEEGRELDYISDSSDEISDDEAKVTKEMQGVSEEKALKSLLTSDEDEDEDEEKKDKNKEDATNTDVDEEDKAKKEENKPKQATPSKKKKKQLEKKSKKDSDTDSDSSVDSSDIDNEMLRKRPLSSDGNKDNVDQSSTNSNNSSSEPAQKKQKLDFSSIVIPETHGITEEAVRRYLSRKPITTTQLVSKFKNRSNLSSDQLVSIIALLLKKINPEKKNIKNKMYLSLKHA